MRGRAGLEIATARTAQVALVAVMALALWLLLAPAGASAVAATGEIEGIVTSAVTSAPLRGIEVCPLAEEEYEGESFYEFASECEKTEANGHYTLENLPVGSYVVEFYARGSSPDYATQYYEASSTLEGAKAVSVAAGKATTEINAVMQEGASISGQITSASTGAPVSPALACALQEVAGGEVSEVKCAEDEASGEYTITKLPAGKYEIGFIAPVGGYVVPQYYEQALNFEAAKQVTVAAGAEVSSVDIALQPGGAIAGVVTSNSIEKQPLEGIEVCAIEVGGEGESDECEATNKAGEYEISDLASGTYLVEFDGTVCSLTSLACEEVYLAQLYNGVTSLKTATPTEVTVSAPGVTRGIDASMAEKSPKQPVNVQPPALTGSMGKGSTLTCSEGEWQDNPTSLSYAWLRNGVVIAGQSASTYTTQNADEGAQITCSVTASNPAGLAVATSNALGVPVFEMANPNTGKSQRVSRGLAIVIRLARTRGSHASMKLRCGKQGACKGVVRILATVTGRVFGHGRKPQVKSFMHLVVIGSVKFSIAAGKRKKVTLNFNAAGRRLLSATRNGALSLRVKGTDVKPRKLMLKA
ncbi:MAG TPA: hypothetical protein VGF95_00205 [Solirubrobacteraceae bacterium]|jgi:hypothetical protein